MSKNDISCTDTRGFCNYSCRYVIKKCIGRRKKIIPYILTRDARISPLYYFFQHLVFFLKKSLNGGSYLAEMTKAAVAYEGSNNDFFSLSFLRIFIFLRNWWGLLNWPKSFFFFCFFSLYLGGEAAVNW